MNLKEIKEMINLMNENDLSEIEVEREGTKIKIKKSSAQVTEMPRAAYPPQFQVEASPASSNNAATGAGSKKNFLEVVSPMVGTFYRAPSPEAASFVDVGQIVEVGQVVCIVEAMKLMNEIKSEVRGRVVEVVVENAQPVEFGQPLFLVEPV